MTTPTKTSDNRSINWKMMKKADAEAKILNAAIEANMIWSKIDISENPSKFSEEIIEESEVDEDRSEVEYDTDKDDDDNDVQMMSSNDKEFDDDSDNDELISSDNEEFDDDDDNDEVMISGDEESENEEESEEDRINRLYLELNRYSDSDPE